MPQPHLRWFEPLEPRTLLSASLDAGVLTLTGSEGDDKIVIVAGRNAGEVVVRGVEGVENGRRFEGVNQIEVLAGGGDDRVQVKGGLRDSGGDLLGVRIDGGTGDDKLKGGMGDDTLLGGDGDDKLIGGGGDDTLDGGAGDDKLVGGSGDDELRGDEGHDKIKGGKGADRLHVNSDEDKVRGRDRRDEVTDDGRPGGGSADLADGVLTVRGTERNDHIVIRAGDNRGEVRVLGLSGVDEETIFEGVRRIVVFGGEAEDHLEVEAGIVDADGNAVDSTLDGGEAEDTLIGGDGNDELIGGEAEDIMEGRGGNDRLSGGEGSDTLRGGDGDDELSGGKGQDTIDGGAGADTVVPSEGQDEVVGVP